MSTPSQRNAKLAVAATAILLLAACRDEQPVAQPDASPTVAEPAKPVAPAVAEPAKPVTPVVAEPAKTVTPVVPTPSPSPQAGTWSFDAKANVDTFDAACPLDLRRLLNESVAGDHGFIKTSADGSDFERGDGQAIRFWPVNHLAGKTLDERRDSARFLAKRGVNMVRFHMNVPVTDPKKGSDINQIDPEVRNEIWSGVAAAREAGIYTTLSIYYPHATKPNPNWQGIDPKHETMSGVLYVDKGFQAAYKEWWRQVLLPVNPHTGIALKDDPALAILQMQNEDGMLFWTALGLKGPQRIAWEKAFAAWSIATYGSLDLALAAWDKERYLNDNPADHPADTPAEGRLGMGNLWLLTSEGIAKKGQPILRMRDQARFTAEIMRSWDQEFVRFLREEIGCKQLVNLGNWRTVDDGRLIDLERYPYTAGDVIGFNRYVNGGHIGQYSGWAIVAGDRFSTPSCLREPEVIPVAVRQPKGKPFIIPECNWTPPSLYQAEGPFISAVYGCLTGVDGLYWWTVQSNAQWRNPGSANGYLPSEGKWIITTPEVLGNFPAAALLYRGGLLKRGAVAVEEHRSLADMWATKPALLTENEVFDLNRDAGNEAKRSTATGAISKLAFLTGPVEVAYGADPATTRISPDLGTLIDEQARRVRSNTGEITMEYGKGVCLVDGPRAQGVAGFLTAAGRQSLTHLELTSTNDYAVVLVVPVDGKPLAESEQVLVQAGTTCRPTGWSDRPVTWKGPDGHERQGFEVVDFGKAPWQIRENRMDITLKGMRCTTAVALDMSLMPAGRVPATLTGGNLSFTMPVDRKYVLLTR